MSSVVSVFLLFTLIDDQVCLLTDNPCQCYEIMSWFETCMNSFDSCSAFGMWNELLCQAERWLEVCEEFWKSDFGIEKCVLAIVKKKL